MAGVAHTQGPAGHTAATPALLAKSSRAGHCAPADCGSPGPAPPRAHTALSAGRGLSGPGPARELQASGNALPGWAFGRRLPTPDVLVPGGQSLQGHGAGVDTQQAGLQSAQREPWGPSHNRRWVQEPLPHFPRCLTSAHRILRSPASGAPLRATQASLATLPPPDHKRQGQCGWHRQGWGKTLRPLWLPPGPQPVRHGAPRRTGQRAMRPRREQGLGDAA